LAQPSSSERVTRAPDRMSGQVAHRIDTRVNFSTVFAIQAVGIRESNDDIWLVSFIGLRIGILRSGDSGARTTRKSVWPESDGITKPASRRAEYTVGTLTIQWSERRRPRWKLQASIYTHANKPVPRQRSARVLFCSVTTGAGGHWSYWIDALVLRLLEELKIECLVGHSAKIQASEPRKQKNDRRDARLLLKLLAENRFPSIWMPSREQRDSQIPLRHRHRSFTCQPAQSKFYSRSRSSTGWAWTVSLDCRRPTPAAPQR